MISGDDQLSSTSNTLGAPVNNDVFFNDATNGAGSDTSFRVSVRPAKAKVIRRGTELPSGQHVSAFTSLIKGLGVNGDWMKRHRGTHSKKSFKKRRQVGRIKQLLRRRCLPLDSDRLP